MDLQKFMTAKFQPRTAELAVPELSDFFPKGVKPVWTVRGLNSNELARTREAGENHDAIKSLVSALAGQGDKAKAIQDTLGLSEDEVPADVSRRIEVLRYGSLSPDIREMRDVAVKLAENYPVTFYLLTSKVQELTGQGSEVGKPKGSIKSQKSEPA